MFTIIAHAADTAGAAGTGTSGTASLLSTLGIFIIPLALLYFFMVMPQKKKEKEAQKLRDSLMVGDEVVSVGGIVGKVLKVKEDEVTIETGADKNRLVLKKWAVSTVTKKTEVSRVEDDDADAYLDEYVEEDSAKGKKKKK